MFKFTVMPDDVEENLAAQRAEFVAREPICEWCGTPSSDAVPRDEAVEQGGRAIALGPAAGPKFYARWYSCNSPKCDRVSAGAVEATPEVLRRMEPKPHLTKLFRHSPETREGKYLVIRRDGSVVEWPSFILGARDPDAPGTLREYAALIAERPDCNPDLPASVRQLADEFDAYRLEHGAGDPTRGRPRKDDPDTVAVMRGEQRVVYVVLSVGGEGGREVIDGVHLKRALAEKRVAELGGLGFLTAFAVTDGEAAGSRSA